ncbi:MAG TPA: VWA domain-containing protein [Acidimicrobiales bacterium]|nr:VWA domain-containing protein [Acidimicrobiales bacterium]
MITSGPDLAEVASRLSVLLRAAGVPVTPERASRLAAAVSLHPPATRSELYWLARVTLVGSAEHLDAFERVFAAVFTGLVDEADWRGQDPHRPTLARRAAPGPRPDRRPPRTATPPGARSEGPVLPGTDEGGAPGPETAGNVLAASSRDERLRHKDFSSLDEEELAALRVLAARLPAARPLRRGRRRHRHHRGDEVDLRATLRRARRTGGQPVRTLRTARRPRPRRLVLLCDVSGSMEPYARAYLQLLLGGVAGGVAEAFVFSTRLTRVTRTLRGRPDAALERAGRTVPDWSGGTRLGEAVQAFNDDHGRRGMARGAVVVIISDGWDRGDPSLLGREMERLGRLAHRVVWVNPRKARPGYAPLAGGMAAALPHVDAFVAGHNLAAFDEVLSVLAD